MAGPNQITSEHDAIILRAMVAAVLSQRRSIYSTPGLEDVNGNGGSRINQRIQIMLKKMCDAHDAGGIVAEEVGKAARRPAAGHTATKPSRAGKKRKVDEAEDAKLERIV